MSETWLKKDLPLKERHGWKSTPGYNICAINRGAIRFEYPEGWNLTADSDSLKIRDLPAPDDNCVLKVSQMHLPLPIADQVPLQEFVRISMERRTHARSSKGMKQQTCNAKTASNSLLVNFATGVVPFSLLY